MKQVKEKLRQRNGATLIMALILVSVCTMVSTMLVLSATTASRAVSNEQSVQQSYLSVESAANALKQEICGKEAITITKAYFRPKTDTAGEVVKNNGKLTYLSDTGISQQTVKNQTFDTNLKWLDDIYTALKFSASSTYSTDLTITGDGLLPVTAHIDAKRDDAQKPRAVMYITLSAGVGTEHPYSMKLTFTADLTVDSKSGYERTSYNGTSTFNVPAKTKTYLADTRSRYRWVRLDGTAEGLIPEDNIEAKFKDSISQNYDELNVWDHYQNCNSKGKTATSCVRYIGVSYSMLKWKWITETNETTSKSFGNSVVKNWSSAIASSAKTSFPTQIFKGNESTGYYYLIKETWYLKPGVSNYIETDGTKAVDLYAQTTTNSMKWNNSVTIS